MYVCIDSGSSRTSDPQRLLLNLSDNIDLQKKDKYVALSNFSIYYTQESIKQSYKNNKSKILVPKWNEQFELPDGAHSVSDIQDYCKYIFKKHETIADNSSMII